MLFRILFGLALIALVIALSVTDTPHKRIDANKQLAQRVRQIITQEGPGLPERAAQQKVVARAAKLPRVRAVKLMNPGDSLASLCARGLKARTLYLAFPSVTSSDGGIYGGLYATSSSRVLSIIVLSPVARATDPRSADVLKNVDGHYLHCKSQNG